MEIIREKRRREQELAAEALGLDAFTAARGLGGPRIFVKEVRGLLEVRQDAARPTRPNPVAVQNASTGASYAMADLTPADSGAEIYG